MLRISEIDIAKSATPDDIDVFLDNTAWAICSTYLTVPSTDFCGTTMLATQFLQVPPDLP
jgi:hypothetical protein